MNTVEICLGVGLNQFFPEYIKLDFEPISRPCKFDHNGECLICDCWSQDCAYIRLINQDYCWESKDELEKMFYPNLKIGDRLEDSLNYNLKEITIVSINLTDKVYHCYGLDELGSRKYVDFPFIESVKLKINEDEQKS
jgi:hypothetical protein